MSTVGHTTAANHEARSDPKTVDRGAMAPRQNGIRPAGRRTLDDQVDDQVVIAPRMAPVMRCLKRVTGHSSLIGSACCLRII